MFFLNSGFDLRNAYMDSYFHYNSTLNYSPFLQGHTYIS